MPLPIASTQCLALRRRTKPELSGQVQRGLVRQRDLARTGLHGRAALLLAVGGGLGAASGVPAAVFGVRGRNGAHAECGRPDERRHHPIGCSPRGSRAAARPAARRSACAAARARHAPPIAARLAGLFPAWRMRVHCRFSALAPGCCSDRREHLEHALPLLAIALLKVVLPFAAVRRLCNPLRTGLAESWIGFNSLLIVAFTRTRFVLGETRTAAARRALPVLANHCSWVDIPVLQKVFNRRIPLLRFFLKSELFWVPLLATRVVGAGFPLHARYTREQIARRPELAGRDIAATRRLRQVPRDFRLR